jgi:sugar O-acyltransferase (sialic acid O-acetyltransferase NeuD family)
MELESVAFIGWHEGSAGQIHSWFEDAGLGKVKYFIHPEKKLPEIKRVKRCVSKFDYPENGLFKGIPLICDFNWPKFLKYKGIKKVLVTIPDPESRFKEIQKAKLNDIELINAVHPTATLLPESKMAVNIILHAKSIIGYRAELDEGVIVNIGSQIDHHCKIMESVTIDPGVTIAGNVCVGRLCKIHTGVVIINRIEIGEGSILGAGTVVIQDVLSYSKIVGVPGKNITF